MKTATTDRYKYRRAPKSNYHHEEDVGWYALAAAIVKQAVMDYQFADACLKGEKVVKESSYSSRMQHRAEHTKDEVVKFLKSQWYGVLCDIPSEKILRKLGVNV